MSSYLDETYLLLISSKLERFKKKSDHIYNCRCRYCGDSKKNKYKSRGYFYEMKDILCYKCQNCNYSCSFSNFLKDIDPNLHKNYIFEKFKDSNKVIQKIKPEPEIEQRYDLSSLVSIKELPITHKARVYIQNRKIPENFWEKLYYTKNYKKWVNEYIIKDKFPKIPETDERIIIPFCSKDGNIFAFQGRTLSNDPNIERYITIKDGKELLVYGLDRVDITKEIYLLEGPLDATFIINAIAAAGSSLKKLIKSKLDIVFCFDKENRSKEIIGLMEEIIKNNRKIVIWDEKYDCKDINDMIIKYDISQGELMKYLKKRTFQGLSAQLEFQKFKKI